MHAQIGGAGGWLAGLAALAVVSTAAADPRDASPAASAPADAAVPADGEATSDAAVPSAAVVPDAAVPAASPKATTRAKRSTSPLDDARAAAEPAEAPGEPRPSTPFTWQPFGYLRMQYLAVQSDPNVAFVGRDDGFELQNVRVGARGKLFARVAFVVALDGAVDEREQVNSTDGKRKLGLRDAFADVGLTKGPGQDLTDRLVVRAGLFHAWADPEALIADTARLFVDEPIESRGMRATEGYETAGLAPRRSLGAALRFEPAPPREGVKLGFELAVQNGAAELASNNDNDKPAVSAAAIARLPRDGWLVIAGRYNPRSVGALPFRQDEDDLQGSAGLRFVVGPVTVGGGVVAQRTTFPTTDGPAQTAYGAHGEAMVAIPGMPDDLPLAIGYRFGILDPSSLITTDRVMEHTAGAVLAVPRYRMRFQLQVTHVVEQAARALDNDRAQLAAELAL